MNENLVSIRVWGDFACFTRPEMKVERVSYPIMTPSAARGIMEAIFWEPEVLYLIHSISVVKKGLWVAFERNEITKTVSLNNLSQWMRDPSRFDPVCAGGGARDGTQRNMLALEDVEYIISAEMNLTKLGQRAEQRLIKYVKEFERRASQGKCFHRPCLGMREFAADFDWEPDSRAALERRAAETREDKNWLNIWPNEDLGLMLYDLFSHESRQHGFKWASYPEPGFDADLEMGGSGSQPKKGRKTAGSRATPLYEGKFEPPEAMFFRAMIRDATMACHPEQVQLIRRNQKEV